MTVKGKDELWMSWICQTRNRKEGIADVTGGRIAYGWGQIWDLCSNTFGCSDPFDIYIESGMLVYGMGDRYSLGMARCIWMKKVIELNAILQRRSAHRKEKSPRREIWNTSAKMSLGEKRTKELQSCKVKGKTQRMWCSIILIKSRISTLSNAAVRLLEINKTTCNHSNILAD